jgi:hypothetical protein
MDRSDAEAICDSGREVCVQLILELAARVERLEERLSRLEAQARQDSRTSSKPPSQDPPKTCEQRRAEARAKAKGYCGGSAKAQGWWAARASWLGAGADARIRSNEIVEHYAQAWWLR